MIPNAKSNIHDSVNERDIVHGNVVKVVVLSFLRMPSTGKGCTSEGESEIKNIREVLSGETRKKGDVMGFFDQYE